MKKTLPFLLLFLTVHLSAQVISSSRWTDLFSYNNVIAVRADEGKLIAATENGIFYYTPASGELTKLSKANGLHEVKISAFDYNPETKVGLVGYLNGSMDVITPEGITYVVDIPLATGYNGNKKINHISITGNLAVISVGYGVSIFRLDRKEFADSSFFVTRSGIYEASREAIIKDNVVYAATTSGLKSHEINTTFTIYSSWTTVAAGSITQLATGSVVAFSDDATVRYGSDLIFSTLPQNFSGIKDVVVTPENIIVTEQTTVSVFGLSGNFIRSYSAGEALNTATYSNAVIYAGTLLSGIKNENGDVLKPDGPYNSASYKITLQNNNIWISTGNRAGRFNFAAPHPSNLGFYHFTGTEWIYPSYFKTAGFVFNVLDVVANPSDITEVFFTNYSQQVGQGTYKMKYNSTSKDFDFIKLYTTGSSASFGRPVGLAFDDKNNLFGTVAFLDIVNPTGDDAGLMAYDRSADIFRYKSLQIGAAVQKPVIAEGLVWVPLPRKKVLSAVDYKGTVAVNDDQVIIISGNNGLPSNSEGIISVAIDKTGDAWIGTDNGIRVLTSASSNVKHNPTVEPIVIEENGVGEELFRDSSILQIEVDSGNQKWVSVNGGGVFYLSSTGEQTIKHFTKENSPLPNNSITDIKVDNKTGKVYFVSLDGVMVYQGDVLDVNENFGEVLVYPNPVVYSKYKGNVRIRGLAEKTNIRITDAAGNLVHQAVSRGGYYEWNLNNHRGVRVASGIYFVLMTNADGTDKASAKIGVVN